MYNYITGIALEGLMILTFLAIQVIVIIISLGIFSETLMELELRHRALY